MKQLEFKICMVGPKGSGKTSLISRFCAGEYSHQEPAPRKERKLGVYYDKQLFEVFLHFHEDLAQHADAHIIAVDLRQEQAVVDDQIARFSRKLSFVTQQPLVVLGLCTDAQRSTVNSAAIRHAELSSVNGAGVEAFFNSFIYELVEREVIAQREEDLFQAGDFAAASHTNIPLLGSDAVVYYCSEHGIARFMLAAVLDACEQRPADFRQWLLKKCKSATY